MTVVGRLGAARGRVAMALGLTGVLVATLIAGGVATPASAATADSFDPGMIITDSLFFDGNALSADGVQKFLNSQVAECRSGYTCLKDYRQDTASRAADPMCDAYTGTKDESAATIIHKVGKACGISQKALIVLLQKEQALVTDTWPTARQYRSATGYGCPDTAACDSEYYGFFNQVYKGAWALKRYTMPAGTGYGTEWSSQYTRYAAGKTVAILYNPKASCGTKTVKIRNKATGSLYYYTPYTPNAAAISANRGIGDGCSAYGNRNFFVFYSDWFGSPKGYTVASSMVETYRAAGGATGGLGEAIGTVKTYSTAGGGSVQKFEGGSIYSSAAGTFALTNTMRAAYIGLGSIGGALGWPASGGLAYSENGGGTVQRFQGGVLYSSASGTYLVSGGIRDRYQKEGSVKGSLGWPRTAELSLADSGGGTVQRFTGGAIYSSPTGTYTVKGKLRSAYIAAGSVAGVLGWPTTNSKHYSPNGGGDVQRFGGGVIYSSTEGTFAVSGDIRTKYLASKAISGQLGWPRSIAKQYDGANGPGLVQRFVGGAIYSSASGTFTVGGKIRSKYAQTGSVTGPLGWPVGSEKATSSGRMQKFQHGTITWSTDEGAIVSN